MQASPRSGAGVVLAVLLCLLASASPAAATHTEHAGIQLAAQPVVGRPGTVVRLTGSGFAAEYPVEITWNTSAGERLTTTTGPTFSVDVVIPWAPPGEHGLVATQTTPQGILDHSASTSFFITAPPPARGYWLTASDGGIFAFGDAPFYGSTGGLPLNKPVVGMAPTPTGGGYWLTASDGGIFSFGDAPFHGSTGAFALNQPIVAMATTPTGGGYWLTASDGGIFAFGDALFFGSTGGTKLTQPIVGMAATVSGKGYWLAAADGKVFPFGDARTLTFPGPAPSPPVVGIAAGPFEDSTFQGYWLASANGAVSRFGNAGSFGSMSGAPLTRPIVGMSSTGSGQGYWLTASDGGIFSFGDAGFFGSTGGLPLNQPIVGMASTRAGAVQP